jgi:hypothetical protein
MHARREIQKEETNLRKRRIDPNEKTRTILLLRLLVLVGAFFWAGRNSDLLLYAHSGAVTPKQMLLCLDLLLCPPCKSHARETLLGPTKIHTYQTWHTTDVLPESIEQSSNVWHVLLYPLNKSRYHR